jgi:sugar phosphate permease
MTLSKKNSSFFTIFLLILAGESVFILPFVLARIFRPTFLEVFEINNTELGYCFSVYGIVALFSYLFGGPLADKFHPRKLMSIALLLTSLGGLYLATFPSFSYMIYLYGFWGFTTIFLFWAAMIKATRIWGGTDKQGIAFGFLDGGRGLVAAIFGSVGVYIFSLFLPESINNSSFIERQIAFKQVLLFCSTIVAFVALLIFFFLKSINDDGDDKIIKSKLINIKDFKTVSRLPAVWLLMIIVLCAYFGYKMTDVFSLYAKDVMLYDDIASAKVGTYLLYMRPIIGVVIGLMADRTRASLWLIIGFLLMLVTSLIFSSDIIASETPLMFALSIGLMALGVYSARVLYFATLEEGKIPLALTGTAVGFISIIGYTPDIFSGPIIGVLLDNSPGVLGHQRVFLVMSCFSFIGLCASILFFKLGKPTKLLR